MHGCLGLRLSIAKVRVASIDKSYMFALLWACVFSTRGVLGLIGAIGCCHFGFRSYSDIGFKLENEKWMQVIYIQSRGSSTGLQILLQSLSMAGAVIRVRVRETVISDYGRVSDFRRGNL